MKRLFFFYQSNDLLKLNLKGVFTFCLGFWFSVGFAETQSRTNPTEISLISDRASCPSISPVSKNLISVEGLFAVINAQPSSLSGAGYQLGLNTAINEIWGFGLMVGQGFTSTSTTFFTQTSLELKRAITGRLIHETSSTDYSGLMLHAFLHRLFVSTSSFDVGHFGLGSAISYQLPLNQADSFRLGLRADYSHRAQASFFSFQLFTGLNHRF